MDFNCSVSSFAKSPINGAPIEPLPQVVKVVSKEVKLVTKPMSQLVKPIGRFTVWSDMDGPGL